MHEEDYGRGIELFNRGEFYEAHEVLEDVWRPSGQPERRFLQGLIQVAVALHHHSQGNVVGARSLLARARRNLNLYPPAFGGIELADLRNALDLWQQALDSGSELPPAPQLRVLKSQLP
jgi:hypothetical protein